MPRSSPRAVVADDSHFMRSVISDILLEGGIDVVAQARNGHEAVEAVREHDPDVVTMDVEMPEMDGIEAVERIMAQHPTPILMLSAHTDEDADVTFEALQKGAVDFFTKPGGEVSMEMSRLKDQLVDIVRSVAQAEPRVGDTAAETTSPDVGAERPDAATDRYDGRPTLVIGSSTGGPTVVEQVMSSLPLTASLRVLIVQHMPGGFTGRFAERLDARSEYDISEAHDGARIGGGEALVAAGDQHMEVANYSHGRLRVSLTDDPPVNSVRPAVDVTMKSVAEAVDDRLIGVILTGMGEDGADGIRALKERGAQTIAQDEASSAVFGMPKRAIETGCVDTVTSIESIPMAILDAVPQEGH